MPAALRLRFQQIIDENLVSLQLILEQDAAKEHTGWNAKQELGHLLDSAANNHLRFVRAALEGEFQGPVYKQNEWVNLHGYKELPWVTLIDFWYGYNSVLAHMVGRIEEERLSAQCLIGENAPVTLAFLIEDYLQHMQHHLDHILLPPVQMPVAP